jgi:hypothetical protein
MYDWVIRQGLDLKNISLASCGHLCQGTFGRIGVNGGTRCFCPRPAACTFRAADDAIDVNAYKEPGDAAAIVKNGRLPAHDLMFECGCSACAKDFRSVKSLKPLDVATVGGCAGYIIVPRQRPAPITLERSWADQGSYLAAQTNLTARFHVNNAPLNLNASAPAAAAASSSARRKAPAPSTGPLLLPNMDSYDNLSGPALWVNGGSKSIPDPEFFGTSKRKRADRNQIANSYVKADAHPLRPAIPLRPPL